MQEELKIDILQTFRSLRAPRRVATDAVNFCAQPFYLKVKPFLLGEFKCFSVSFFRHFELFSIKKLITKFFILPDHLPCLVAIPLILHRRNEESDYHQAIATNAYR